MAEDAHPLEIELLPSTRTEIPLTVEITDLINKVYAVAENGLWLDGAVRTTVEEVTSLIETEQIAIARINNHIVGCVRIQHLGKDTGEFGMLVADPQYRGVGIGRELVQFAEQKCYDSGLSFMQLELLIPQNWPHPSKVFLADWYSRIGYRVLRTSTLDEAYPGQLPLLATPCDFVIYGKTLRPA